MNKKIALSLAMIAASGAYAFKEGAGRSDWLGGASPLTIAGRDTAAAPRATAPEEVATLPDPIPAPVAIDPPASSFAPRREHGDGAERAKRSDEHEYAAREIRARADSYPPATAVAQPVQSAPLTWPHVASVAVFTPVTPASAPVLSPASAKPPGAPFRDGTFTGSNADAYWGNLQVRAVITGGKLVSVDVLAYPADRRRSQEINRYALPLLQQEVVKAQSVNVNIVSGATLTAKAYLASLRSALQQAQ